MSSLRMLAPCLIASCLTLTACDDDPATGDPTPDAVTPDAVAPDATAPDAAPEADATPEADAAPDAENPPPDEYDFSAVEARMQQLIDQPNRFDGLSLTLVHAEHGTIYEVALGDHTPDTVALLASTSKMPAVMALMALQDDPEVDFDMTAPIEQYLPFDGVYGDRTVEQLMRNTSGMPGLDAIEDYGAHFCQYDPNGDFDGCVQAIYQNEVAGSRPPSDVFWYGGSQWQLAGGVARYVAGVPFQDVFDAYIGEPCGLEVFEFGNPWGQRPPMFDGDPASLPGRGNPNIEGGGISTMQDYARLLQIHLNGGRCGETQVLSPESVAFMQTDRIGAGRTALGGGYGLGWWIDERLGADAPIYADPGAFGAISWIDPAHGVGGYLAVDEYAGQNDPTSWLMVLTEIVPMVRSTLAQ